jgi:hypothetical protein
MSFLFWLRNWTRSQACEHRRTYAAPCRRPSISPRLEALEDRRLPSTYYAATVTDLIADINAANNAGGANTILLTAATTSPYQFTATNNSRQGNTVLPVIAKGDNLTIRTSNGAVDPGYGDTLDAAQFGRLFVVAAGGSLTLQNVTLQGGFVYGSGTARGGAVYNLGTLDLNHALITGNEADGNISFNPKKSFDAAGGGIWSNGSLTVENRTVVESNTARGEGTANGYGGGICIAGGTATLADSTLDHNWAVGGYNPNTGQYSSQAEGFGGGLYVGAGTATLTNDDIEYNWAGSFIDGTQVGIDAPGYGGGIFIVTGSAKTSLDSYTVAHTVNNNDGNGVTSTTANIGLG